MPGQGLQAAAWLLPLDIQARVRFNPAVSSRYFLVPGLIAVIMTLSGALLTAMVIAREWERGTMEALMVTRVRMREILLAKLVPYFALGMGGMVGTVLLATLLFSVLLVGSLLVLTGVSALFMLTALIVALGVHITGTLLVGALVIIPPATARLTSRSLRRYARLSTALGAASCIAGVLVYRLTHFPAGPAIILVNASLFVLAFGLRHRYPALS